MLTSRMLRGGAVTGMRSAARSIGVVAWVRAYCWAMSQSRARSGVIGGVRRFH